MSSCSSPSCILLPCSGASVLTHLIAVCRSPGGTGPGTCARSTPTAWAPRWTARSSPPATSPTSRSGAQACLRCMSARRAPRPAYSARARASSSRTSSSPSRILHQPALPTAGALLSVLSFRFRDTGRIADDKEEERRARW